MPAITLDMFEYANDPAAQAAYVSSDTEAVPASEYNSDGDTKLLLHCNGADESVIIPDSGDTNHGNANVEGDAQLDTAQKKFGTASLLLDGTGDYIYYADHNDWNFGTGAFTIDFWIRFNSVAVDQNFYSQVVDANNRFFVSWASSKLYIFNVNAGVNTWLEVAWSPVVDTWYHLAFVRSGNTAYIFVDGSLKNSGAFDCTVLDLAANAEIGRRNEGGGIQYVNGWIDEFRISKGVARWTSDFDIPNLQCYSEAATKQQGSYSLKTVAVQTRSLNDYLERTIGAPIDLSGRNTIKFDIRASRTGGNIKVGIRDSGSVWTEKTYTVLAGNTWETVTWDISGVADANKDAIDRIKITILNADAINTFYIDNMYAEAVAINALFFGANF